MWRLAVLGALAVLVCSGTAFGAPPAQAGGPLGGWRPVGHLLLMDVPASAGVVLDVNPFRSGRQTLVVVLHNEGMGQVRFSTLFGRVLGEGPDGGFSPERALAAGWRGFAWGDAGGAARVWTPAFDSARSLLSVDPELPCGVAADASTPLAGPFEVTVPAGARPGGQTVASPASAFVYGSPSGGVRIATAAGVTLGRSGSGSVQGGFALAGSVFAYGTAGGEPALWSPALVSQSTSLVSGEFVACTEPPPFDGTSTPVPEASQATSAKIGPDGGVITAGGVTLRVPPGALLDERTITVTPLSDVEGPPFEELLGGVQLEPEGLRFLIPASLELPLPAGRSPAEIVGFGYTGDGSGFHLVPRQLTGGSIVLSVWHFSGMGAVAADPSQLEAMLSYEPTPGHELAEQQVAAAVNAAEQNGSDPTPGIDAALRRWYQSSVRNGLQVALGASQEFFELAAGEWSAWTAVVQAQGRDDAFAAELAEALRLVNDVAADLASRVLSRCTGTGADPFGSLRDVARLAAAVELLALPIETRLLPDGTSSPRTLPDGSPFPSGLDLPTACATVRIDGVDHAPALAVDRDNAFSVRASVAFANGGARTDIPLTIRLLEDGVPFDADTVTGGLFQTTLAPDERGALVFEVKAEIEGADDALRALTANQNVSIPVRDRIELQGMGPAEPSFADTVDPINPSETVTLRVRLAGDGMAGAAVEYENTGVGSLAASSDTTSPQGEALVTYTAPSDPDGGTAPITASALGESDSLTITVERAIVVSMSPGSVTLNPGAAQQFTATVTNATNTDVTWSATGGTITQSGLYTAGTTPGSFTVTATSDENPSRSATATITIASVCGSGDTLSGTVTMTYLQENEVAEGHQTIAVGAQANVVACVSPDGRDVTLAAISGMTSHVNQILGVRGTVCEGELALSVTAPSGQQLVSRYDAPASFVQPGLPAGFHPDGILWGAWRGPCERRDPDGFTLQFTGSSGCRPSDTICSGTVLGYATHIIESGRIVGVDFDLDVDADYALQVVGRLLPAE
jgi:hypothetical protein